jgi:hypothetical protein
MPYTLRLLLSVAILSIASQCTGQERIDAFFPKAFAKTQAPPDEAALQTICQTKVDERHVTFLGIESNKVLLAALTKHKLKDPPKSIWLKLRYAVSKGKAPGVHPQAMPPKDGTMDWGYIFDRNGDGKIDYLAYLFGPYPVEGKDFPADFPKANGRVDRWSASLDSQRLEVTLKSIRMVFQHAADDNFDGKVDALVVGALDPETGWLDGWVIDRELDFTGVANDCRYFKDDITVKAAACEATASGHRVQGKNLVVNLETDEVQVFASFSDMLATLNRGAAACGLTKGSFYSQ